MVEYIHGTTPEARLLEWARQKPWANYAPLWGGELCADLKAAAEEIERLHRVVGAVSVGDDFATIRQDLRTG